MSYDGYMKFNNVELFNVARTLRLARLLGINNLALPFARAAQTEALSGTTQAAHQAITTAPWYDPNSPASMEFAGVLPNTISAIEDSSLESSPIEYTDDGGSGGKTRNTTVTLVASAAIIASTERGAEYGKRWLMRLLAGRGAAFATGVDLSYYSALAAGSPLRHRRNVKTTRGVQITRKRNRACYSVWSVTFTLVDADGHEYGSKVAQLADLGGAVSGKPTSSGTVDLVQTEQPVYSYKPFYDPANSPALDSPQAPNFYPFGWNLATGRSFRRYWARIPAVTPSLLNVVPFITLRSTTEARMVKVGVWSGASANNVQGTPMFGAVSMYVPPNQSLFIDGEARTAYVSDGLGSQVRRADSLVYSFEAFPVDWTAFNDPAGMLVTLDTYAKVADDVGGYPGPGYQGDGNVRMDLSFVSKGD